MKSLAENRQAKDGMMSFLLPVFVRTLSMSTFHAKGLTRTNIITIIVQSVNMQFPSGHGFVRGQILYHKGRKMQVNEKLLIPGAAKRTAVTDLTCTDWDGEVRHPNLYRSNP
jgi:hypothetical protein